MIRLTEDQAQELEISGNSPVDVVDPHSSRRLFLVDEANLEQIRDVLRDDRDQRVLEETAWENLGQLLKDEPW